MLEIFVKEDFLSGNFQVFEFGEEVEEFSFAWFVWFLCLPSSSGCQGMQLSVFSYFYSLPSSSSCHFIHIKE